LRIAILVVFLNNSSKVYANTYARSHIKVMVTCLLNVPYCGHDCFAPWCSIFNHVAVFADNLTFTVVSMFAICYMVIYITLWETFLKIFLAYPYKDIMYLTQYFAMCPLFMKINGQWLISEQCHTHANIWCLLRDCIFLRTGHTGSNAVYNLEHSFISFRQGH